MSREIFIFVFSADLWLVKSEKWLFFAVFWKFASLEDSWQMKKSKFRNFPHPFFFNTLRMPYTKFWPKIIKIENLHTLLLKFAFKKAVFYCIMLYKGISMHFREARANLAYGNGHISQKMHIFLFRKKILVIYIQY